MGGCMCFSLGTEGVGVCALYWGLRRVGVCTFH